MTDQTLSTKPSPEAVAARGILLGRARWGIAEYAFWAIAIALYFVMPNKLMLLSEIAILGLLALSIDLVLGFAGIVTLGQGAFFGVGAYAAGLAARYGAGEAPWSDPLVGLLIGGGVAGLLGFVTSFLVLRGSDLTRLMVTLGVALIVEELVNQMKWLTGGSDGLQGVMPSAVLGYWDFDLYGKTAYLYSLAVLFVLFFIARRIVKSPFGLSLLAIKGNPLRTRAIGLPINGRLVTVYTIGAIYAGIAGALVTQTTQFASPDYVAFHRSADALLMLVFGGAGHLYGGLIGSVIFRVMQDYLGNITPQYWQFWLGLMLVLLVLFVRGGILGLLAKMRDRVMRKGENAP
ncbi:MAG: branched-chain amino acid transporter permease [Hyphomicrobiales bacterium]|nr:branched-chain amino acid transporter permease [Hyphomicrobiales bacterium]